MVKRYLATQRRSARHIAGAFFLLCAMVTLGGCASLVPQTMGLRDAWPAGVSVRADIPDVPFYPQRDYQCGPAALAMTLVHSGVSVAPDDLVDLVYLPARKGSLQVEMLAASRRYSRVSYPLAPRFDDLLREVAAGNPVIVLQDIGAGPVTNWHYAVVTGFNYPAGELYLHSGEVKRLVVPFTMFEYTWKKGNYWSMVTLPPGRIPATATEAAYLTAVTAMDRVSTPDAAVSAYAAFLERWPDNATASIGLANRRYAGGELKEAEAVLRSALARHPDSVPLLNNLAYVLSDLGRNDEALVHIERALGMEGASFAAAVRETHTLILRRMADKK